MPNVNLTDSRSRDAVVKAETTGVDEEVRYVDDEGQTAYTRKILKATVEHDYETLVSQYDDDADALGKALVEGDPEVDMEICGLYLWGVSKVFVNSSDGIVYRIEQQEIVRGPDGNVKEKRPRNRADANVDSEIPLTWTGRKITKAEAVRRFVFASKLQIVHINGLTYDFLYGMAKELAEADSLMMIGGGSKGRDPLVFRRGSIPYRGFLEGRIEGDKYILLLHMSNLELKVPSTSESKAASTEKKEVKKKEASELDNRSATKKKVSNATSVASGGSKKKPAKKTKKTRESVAEKLPDAIPPKESESDQAKDKTKNSASDKESEKKGTKKKNSKVAVANVSEVKSDKTTTTMVTSEDLGIWLKSIRMGKYLQLFIDNEIDVDVIAELTDADLKELEIPLGSRRRLLKAVEETDNLHAEVAMAVNAMSGKKKSSNTARQKK